MREIQQHNNINCSTIGARQPLIRQKSEIFATFSREKALVHTASQLLDKPEFKAQKEDALASSFVDIFASQNRYMPLAFDMLLRNSI